MKDPRNWGCLVHNLEICVATEVLFVNLGKLGLKGSQLLAASHRHPALQWQSSQMMSLVRRLRLFRHPLSNGSSLSDIRKYGCCRICPRVPGTSFGIYPMVVSTSLALEEPYGL